MIWVYRDLGKEIFTVVLGKQGFTVVQRVALSTANTYCVN